MAKLYEGTFFLTKGFALLMRRSNGRSERGGAILAKILCNPQALHMEYRLPSPRACISCSARG